MIGSVMMRSSTISRMVSSLCVLFPASFVQHVPSEDPGDSDEAFAMYAYVCWFKTRVGLYKRSKPHSEPSLKYSERCSVLQLSPPLHSNIRCA